MTWAKVDDGLYDDPRSEAAGLEAMGLWVASLSYMGRYLTDGTIDEARVRKLAGRRAPALTERLVSAGWWERLEGGKLRLISWDTYLLSRAEVEADRARKSDAGRRGAERTNAKRLDSGPADAAAGVGGSSGASRARDPVPVPSRPDPIEEEDHPLRGSPDGVQAPSGDPSDQPPLLFAPEVLGPKVKGKPDLPVGALSDLEREAHAAIVGDESLKPIVKDPARWARELVKLGPGVDVPQAVRRAGAWLRANPTRAKKNGAAFLTHWIGSEQEKASRRPAEAPRGPGMLARRGPVELPNTVGPERPRRPDGPPPLPEDVRRLVEAQIAAGVPAPTLEEAKASIRRIGRRPPPDPTEAP